MLTKILTWYAVCLGTYRALRTVKQEVHATLVGNEIRTLDVWMRDGTYYHEEWTKP